MKEASTFKTFIKYTSLNILGMLGISCYSYIFSLKKDHKEDLKRIAANMDIQFVDGEMINSKKELVQVIHDMSKLAK